jgi:outer membrane biogenesis lipoprotein LolB
MKALFIALIFLFLQGCETLNIRKQPVTSGSIPESWSAKGRAGVSVDDSYQSVGFDVEFAAQEFELVLVGALGLGKVNIRSTAQGLWVNHQRTSLSLQQWMEQELGWHLPLSSLAKIIFEHRLNASHEWQVKISRFMSYQEVNVAKLVKLQHQHKPIKIKLLFQEVNQLK